MTPHYKWQGHNNKLGDKLLYYRVNKYKLPGWAASMLEAIDRQHLGSHLGECSLEKICYLLNGYSFFLFRFLSSCTASLCESHILFILFFQSTVVKRF